MLNRDGLYTVKAHLKIAFQFDMFKEVKVTAVGWLVWGVCEKHLLTYKW